MVNPNRVQMIMEELGKVEDGIFRERQSRELRFKAMNKAKRRRDQLESEEAPAYLSRGQFAPHAVRARGRGGPGVVSNPRQQAIDMRKEGLDWRNAQKRSSSDAFGKAEESDSDDDSHDEVKLYEAGFKDRYYEAKFGIPPDDPESESFRRKVAAEYTLGLCWVLRYYYQGCSSWKWYFPYHYAPFASDFVGISTVKNEFETDTKPFKPLEQLMGVFPAASRSHVPEPWAELMIDPEAPIIDFYPEDFKIDLNGKKFAWQGVALLPFVDENRLKAALEPLYNKLTEAEIARNIRGDDRLYVREGHDGYNLMNCIYTDSFEKDVEIQIDGKIFQGMRGAVLYSEDCIDKDGMYTSPVRGLRTVEGNRVICVRFRDPKYPGDFIFPSSRLEGARDPPNVLKPGEYTGYGGRGGRGGRGGGYGGGGGGGYGGGGGGGGGGHYRPQMGFAPRNDQASLGAAGHRMLGHHVPSGVPPAPMGGAYSSVPPPMMMGQPEGGYPSQRGRGSGFNRGGSNQRGGGNNYGGQDRHQQGGYGGRHQGRGGHGGGHQQGGYNNYGGNNQRGGYQQNRGGHQNNRGGGGPNRGGGGGYGGGQSNRGQRGNSYGGYFTSGYQQ